MDKIKFKKTVLKLLEQDVIDLSSESKVKYMKKWIRQYELENHDVPEMTNVQEQKKVGLLVQTTLRKIIGSHSLSAEKVGLLQEEKYCKTTFDINYPLLKKVKIGTPLSEQKKINGYDRYWKDAEVINCLQSMV
jgi:hypothetical protein